MQHDHVLKKLTFYLLTPSPGSGLQANICYHVATFLDSNKFDMQHDIVLKSWTLTFWPQVGGICRQNICYQVATFLDSLIIWYATWPCSEIVEWVRGMGGGVCSKISWFPLMWYATWPCFEKVDILPTDRIPRVRSAAKIFATMLLHFMIPINLTCNMTMFWDSGTSQRYGGGGGGGGSAAKFRDSL